MHPVFADYELGDALLTVLWIFGFVVFFWLLIIVFGDLFRDRELSGWVKVLWILFVIVLPFLGIFVYLIARGRGMAERAAAEQARAETQFRSYVQQAAGSGGGGSDVADQLTKLAALRDQGVLTPAEFDAQKAKLLG